MRSPQARGTRGAGSIAMRRGAVRAAGRHARRRRTGDGGAVEGRGRRHAAHDPQGAGHRPHGKNVAILPVSPVSFRFQWEPGLSWWFDRPMASGGTFDYATKKGTFSTTASCASSTCATEQELLWAVCAWSSRTRRPSPCRRPWARPPATRAVVFTATNTPGYTKQGKTIKIDGIQFKLTDAGALAIKLRARRGSLHHDAVRRHRPAVQDQRSTEAAAAGAQRRRRRPFSPRAPPRARLPEAAGRRCTVSQRIAGSTPKYSCTTTLRMPRSVRQGTPGCASRMGSGIQRMDSPMVMRLRTTASMVRCVVHELVEVMPSV